MARYLVTFLPGDPIPKRTKYIDDASGPPDANVDAGTDGVAFGSILWDGTDLWFCVDPTTAAATWEQITGAAGLAAHLADATDAHDASAISFTPNGSIAATDVQTAIVEVRDEAGSSLTGAALTALGVVGPLLIADEHSTPIIFGDLILTEAGDDFLYADLG